jgi:hypothetical protein
MRKLEYTLKEFAVVELVYREKCKEYYTAKAEAEIVKEMSKDVLASIMSEIEVLSATKKMSAVELERRARGLPQWDDFRKGQWAATRKEGQTKAAMLSAKTAWDTIQSGLSYMKTSLGKLGG